MSKDVIGMSIPEIIIKDYAIPTNGSVEIPVPNYGIALILCYFQGVGGKALLVLHSSASAVSVKDLFTGQTFTSNYYSFTAQSGSVTIHSTYPTSASRAFVLFDSVVV